VLIRRSRTPAESLRAFGETQPSDDIPVAIDERGRASPNEIARLRRELLGKELELLRARLNFIRNQAVSVARSGAIWANASARSQLGPYPWAKFAGIALSSFLVTNAVRKLPFGTIVAMAVPLIKGAINQRRRRDGS
jgi:hypothetical protein